jgi:hypothetical protein
MFAVIFLLIIYMLKYILFIFIYIYLYVKIYFIYILFISPIYILQIYATYIPSSQPTTISAHVMRKSDYDMVPASPENPITPSPVSPGNPISQPTTSSPRMTRTLFPTHKKRTPFGVPATKIGL